MNNRRAKIGVAVSIAWLAAMLILLFLRREMIPGMKPNEWGDFFSGCFAPLAFLWLVLGYLQQGEELRLSTKTLELQAEELKNSVEQQRALVEVSREQVSADMLALQQERAAREEESRPRITLECKPDHTTSAGKMYVIQISNVGPPATDLVAEILNRDGRSEKKLCVVKYLEQGAAATPKFNLDDEQEVNGWAIRIRCKSRFGKNVEYFFALSRDIHYSKTGLIVEQFAA